MVPETEAEFLQAIWTRRPFYTYVFFGLNLFIFLLMAFAGGSTNDTTLLAFGVKDNAEIAKGEWWRFLTPVFLHIGLLHLLFNSYALWMVGPQVERLYGSASFVILYVLTGAAGVLGSWYYHPFIPSAGASGAIFGLFGVLLVFGLRYRDSVPQSFKRAVGAGVLPVILINLFIGFSIPGIDNSAHISGLVAGALLAAVVPFQRPNSETPAILKAVQMALLATIVVSFYQVARHYDGPRLSVRNFFRDFAQITGSRSTTADFVQAINSAQAAFEATTDALQSERLDNLAPLKKRLTDAIDQLRKVPSLAQRSDELAAELLRVMQDQYEVVEGIERAGTITFASGRQLKENVRAYDKIMSDFSKWVESNGREYGIGQGKDQ